MNHSITSGEADVAASADVLRRALAGDEAAFELLVLPLVAPAHRLAYALLRDQSLAEDAVQDACLSAWHSLRQLRSAEAIRPWFYAIVANRCRSIARRRPTPASPAVAFVADVRPGPEASIAILAIRECLGRLPMRDRLVLYLRFVEDLTHEEIARTAGLRVGTVKSRLHRALRRLRSELSEEETHEAD